MMESEQIQFQKAVGKAELPFPFSALLKKVRPREIKNAVLAAFDIREKTSFRESLSTLYVHLSALMPHVSPETSLCMLCGSDQKVRQTILQHLHSSLSWVDGKDIPFLNSFFLLYRNLHCVVSDENSRFGMEVLFKGIARYVICNTNEAGLPEQAPYFLKDHAAYEACMALLAGQHGALIDAVAQDLLNQPRIPSHYCRTIVHKIEQRFPYSNFRERLFSSFQFGLIAQATAAIDILSDRASVFAEKEKDEASWKKKAFGTCHDELAEALRKSFLREASRNIFREQYEISFFLANRGRYMPFVGIQDEHGCPRLLHTIIHSDTDAPWKAEILCQRIGNLFCDKNIARSQDKTARLFSVLIRYSSARHHYQALEEFLCALPSPCLLKAEGILSALEALVSISTERNALNADELRSISKAPINQETLSRIARAHLRVSTKRLYLGENSVAIFENRLGAEKAQKFLCACGDVACISSPEAQSDLVKMLGDLQRNTWERTRSMNFRNWISNYASGITPDLQQAWETPLIYETAQGISVEESGNFFDLFSAGQHPVTSCLSYRFGGESYTIPAILASGNQRMVYFSERNKNDIDGRKQRVARAFSRLLFSFNGDSGVEAFLVLEPVYAQESSNHASIAQAYLDFAIQKAEQLGYISFLLAKPREASLCFTGLPLPKPYRVYAMDADGRPALVDIPLTFPVLCQSELLCESMGGEEIRFAKERSQTHIQERGIVQRVVCGYGYSHVLHG